MKTQLLLVSSLALAAGLQAQTQKVVPAVAESAEGNDLTSYPFGRTAFRAQQLFDAAYIAPNLAIINSIEYRADNDSSTAKPAVVINNVQVDVSQTLIDSTTMTTTYAANVTGVPSTVFTGSVSLPAYASSSGGVAPFGIMVPFNTPFVSQASLGNLLVDITATGPNASSGYTLDSALPGGLGRPVGPTGLGVDPVNLVRLLVSANGATQGRFSGLVPGGAVTLIAESRGPAYSGDMFFGLAKFPTPIDLTALGAPGNEFHIDPIMDLPFTMMSTGIANRASVALPVPSNPGLLGIPIYSQAFVIEPAANALGIVMLNGVEMTVGEAGNHPMRMVRGTDPLALTGSFNYTSGILGGPVVRFNGTFN